LYDEAKWEEDNRESFCQNLVGVSIPRRLVIISRKNSGKCIGDQGPVEGSMQGDILIRVFDEENLSLPVDLGGDLGKMIKISGTTGVIYPYTERSRVAREQSTLIYVNRNGRSYRMELVQEDRKGHYDGIFDKILSTIKFFK